MQTNILFRYTVTTCMVLATIFSLPAQSTDGWYRVFTGNIGNSQATLHLHRSATSYNGYLWFAQNQWPMQVYYNEPGKKSDSLQFSANSGPLAVVFYGVLTGDNFTGQCELSKDNGTPKKAGFHLKSASPDSFTNFTYYYAEGNATLPAQLNNGSRCDYASSTIWPVNNTRTGQLYKNEIRQQMGINTLLEEPGKWLAEEKNKIVNGWKKENSKLTPKDASELGMSLGVMKEDRVMVMFENERNITLAHFSYGFSGGAHGNFSTTLACYNKQTGKKLKLSDVVNAAGVQLLPRILEQVARVQYTVKNNKPLDQNGFMVNKIEPHQNFYITGRGIGFMYAPYAIKPFSDGEVNLLVPFAALKGYLQPGFGPK